MPLQKSVRESGERGRGDDKLQATISLSVKRLENYLTVSKAYVDPLGFVSYQCFVNAMMTQT